MAVRQWRLVSAPTGAAEPPTRAGAVDVDRDGRLEIVLQVGHGASTTSHALCCYDGRTLSRVDRANGPLALLAGGPVGHRDGFTCAGNGHLALRQATSDEGKACHVISTVLRPTGAHAVVVHGPATTAGRTTRGCAWRLPWTAGVSGRAGKLEANPTI